MSERIVTARYPFLILEIAFRAGARLEIEVQVDTGFDGHVVVPASSIPPGEERIRLYEWQIADGSIVRTFLYGGSARVVGLSSRIDVAVAALGEAPLVGLAFLRHFSVTFDHGERLIVEA